MRLLVDDDLPALVDLLVETLDRDPAWQHGFPTERSESLRLIVPRLLQLRQRAGARIWVREHEGELVEALTVLAGRSRPGLVAYLRNGLIQVPWRLGLATTRRLVEMDRQQARLRAIVQPKTPHRHLQSLVLTEDSPLLDGWLARVDSEPVTAMVTRAELVGVLEARGFRLRGQDGIDKSFTCWALVNPRS